MTSPEVHRPRTPETGHTDLRDSLPLFSQSRRDENPARDFTCYNYARHNGDDALRSRARQPHDRKGEGSSGLRFDNITPV